MKANDSTEAGDDETESCPRALLGWCKRYLRAPETKFHTCQIEKALRMQSNKSSPKHTWCSQVERKGGMCISCRKRHEAQHMIDAASARLLAAVRQSAWTTEDAVNARVDPQIKLLGKDGDRISNDGDRVVAQ